MRRVLNILGVFLRAIGLILLVLGVWLNSNEYSGEPNSQKIIDQAQQEILDADELITTLKDSLGQAKSFMPWLDKLKSKDLEAFLFYQGKPIEWTCQEFQVSPQLGNQFGFINQNGVYLATWNLEINNYTYVFVSNAFNSNFPQIQSKTAFINGIEVVVSSDSFSNAKDFNVQIKTLDSLKRNSQSFDFYVKINRVNNPVCGDLLLLLGWIFLTAGIYCLSVLKISLWRRIPISALLWMIFALGISNGFIGQSLSQFRLFSPDVFSPTPLLNTLGVSIIWSLIGLWLVRNLKVYRSELTNTAPVLILLLRWVLLLLAGTILFYSADLSAYIIHSTHIAFDFSKLLLIDYISVLSLLLIVIMLASALVILDFVIHTGKSNWSLFISTFIFSGIVGFSDPFTGALLLLFLLIWLGHQTWNNLSFPGIRRWLEIILPALFISAVIKGELVKKERLQQELLAKNLVVKYDDFVNGLLLDIENSFNTDLAVLHFITGNSETEKAQLVENLRTQYFSELNDQFEFEVFDFNDSGKNFRIQNSLDLSALNSLYNSDGSLQITPHFVQITERRLRGAYVGRFPVYKDSQFSALYFTLLTPKSLENNGQLSDQIKPSEVEKLRDENSFSYAIYNRDRLSKNTGSFEYPLQSPFGNTNGFIQKGKNRHFVLYDSFNNQVVVTDTANGLLHETFQFTLFILGGFLIYFFIYWVVWIEKWVFLKAGLANDTMPTSHWLISKKLQLYMTWLLMLIFIIVLTVTVNFFISKNTLAQQQDLLRKTTNIATKISSQISLDQLENKYEVGLVYDLSEAYGADINVFDRYGQLIVSTHNAFFRDRFRGNLMNPAVYRDFNAGKQNAILAEEKISDLEYLSAYSVINDNDLNIRGFVNVPYYSNRNDLYNEISNFVVAIINLFALIFAASLILTNVVSKRISEPLLLIGSKLAKTKLGQRNQPIQWEGEDEIGQLVSEYNRMLAQLDESLNKLAATEREGAWREMAKQVAHEIKNPLTPMRLSLQHLQYSMNRGDDNLKEKISKTADLLIRQIDSLSNMAEEFSSFAKMPEPKLEPTDITQVLADAIALNEREMGFSIEADLCESEIEILADAHQLVRVFNNLLKNAIQAIPDDRKGKIQVVLTLSPNNGKVIIKVKDNGKGIPPELFNKIFSPNFSTKNSGMGLGLAITRKIVEQFSGSIDFETKLDEGTTFTLVFPTTAST
jgi:signal transduction histidine kinase